MSGLGHSRAPQRPAWEGAGAREPSGDTERGLSSSLSSGWALTTPLPRSTSDTRRATWVGTNSKHLEKNRRCRGEDETLKLSGPAGGGRWQKGRPYKEVPRLWVIIWVSDELAEKELLASRPEILIQQVLRSSLRWLDTQPGSSQGRSARGWVGPGTRGDRSPFPTPAPRPLWLVPPQPPAPSLVQFLGVSSCRVS